MMAHKRIGRTQHYVEHTMILMTVGIFILGFAEAAQTYYYWLSPQKALYNNANADCIQRGYIPMVMKTEDEKAYIKSEFQRYLLGNIWVGLSFNESGWYFADGVKLNVNNFNGTPWGAGHPRGMTFNKCAVMSLSDFLWYTGRCFSNQYYFCLSTDPVPLPPLPTTTSTTPSTTEIQTTEMPTQPGMAQCLCSCIINNMTDEEYLERSLEYMANHLVVNKTTTSRNIRKLKSAPDERKSSERIGFVGAVVIAVSVASIIVLDLVTHCKRCI